VVLSSSLLRRYLKNFLKLIDWLWRKSKSLKKIGNWIHCQRVVFGRRQCPCRCTADGFGVWSEKMTSQPNDAASVAELRQQVVDARLCAEQARIEADQLKLDNNRSVCRRITVKKFWKFGLGDGMDECLRLTFLTHPVYDVHTDFWGLPSSSLLPWQRIQRPLFRQLPRLTPD